MIPDDFDLQDAALLGCAVATGVGAVLNTAAVRPGQSVVVFGTGGIGLCAIAGALVVGAEPIIGVDVSTDRLAVAQQMPTAHTVNAAEQEPLSAISEICPGMVSISPLRPAEGPK